MLSDTNCDLSNQSKPGGTWISKRRKAIAIGVSLLISVSAVGADEPTTQPVTPTAAPAPRSAAHIALNDFLELYRKGDPESMREMTTYLDASALDEKTKANLSTLALRLGEFIDSRKIATPEVLQRLSLAKDADEFCIYQGKPLLESEADQPATQPGDEQKEATVCHIRLVKSDDGLWQFGPQTVAKIELLAATLSQATSPADAATNADPTAGKQTPTAAPEKPATATQNVPKKFRSPQATMRSFLQSFDENAKDRVAAADCLNVRERGLSSQDYWSQALARGLKFVLDRTLYVQIIGIPDDPNLPSPYLVETIDETWRIDIERVDDGRWLFADKTLDDLPEMIRAVADAPPKVPNAPKLSLTEMPEIYLLLMVPDWARQQLWILEIWQWIGLLSIIVFGKICDRLAQVILGFASRITARRINEKSDVQISDTTFRPIGLVIMGYVWLALFPLLWLPTWLGTLLTTVSWLVLILAGIWATYRLIEVVMAFVSITANRRNSTFDDLLIPFLSKLLKIIVTIIGIVYFLKRIYPNDVNAILGGLGLGGLAFALAAQDTIKNLFGSITVMLDRPFEIGDWVKIGDVEGTVESVGFRSTHIRTFYNSQINVPNGKLIDATVDNFGRRQYRRISTTLGLTYDTTPEKIDAFCEGIRELIRRHPYTRKDSYHVYFNGFGAHSLDILLYCFHETPDWATELRERHRLFADILRLAQRLGVEFAFPTQTLHLHNADATPPPTDKAPPRAKDLAADILGRSEAAAIAKLTVPPLDTLSQVDIKHDPQPVDERYLQERLGIKGGDHQA